MSYMYQIKILKLLLAQSNLTYQEIADYLGLSIKTVRIYLDQLNTYLIEGSFGEIQTKRGYGVWIACDDEQKVEINRIIQNSNVVIYSNERDARMYQLLSMVFSRKSHDIFTLSSFSENQYISVPTASSVLEDARLWLLQFDVKLENTRNKGIHVIGDEFRIRLAIKHVIDIMSSDNSIENSIETVLPGVSVSLIKDMIYAEERKRQIKFAYDSYKDCLVYTCLAVSRFLNGHLIMVDIDEQETLKTYPEYEFAESIINTAFEYIGSEAPDEEICFLSIQILCSRMINIDFMTNTKDILDEFNSKLDDFVDKLIVVLSNILNIDLSKDQEFQRGIQLHLRSCIFRLKYDRSKDTTLTRFIRKEYQETYRISWVVSVLFEEYFNLKITEGELGYIVIYIQSALERNRAPITVTLVSSSGMGINRFICDRLQRHFMKIERVEIVSFHEYVKNPHTETDLVISTKEVKDAKQAVIQIDDFLSDASLKRIQEEIYQLNTDTQSSKFDVVCHTLFEPDLIFIELDYETKEEVIKHMCDVLYKKGYTNEKFYNSVIEHEMSNSTEIGNYCATPHGNQEFVYQSKVCVATLRKPILWDEEKVSVVFLMVVKTNNALEIQKTQLFCKQYLNIVETFEQVSLLASYESNTELYKYLVR